jgi:hypothetical protein
MGATALTDRCHQTARCLQIGGVHVWIEERNPASRVDLPGFTPLIPAYPCYRHLCTLSHTLSGVKPTCNPPREGPSDGPVEQGFRPLATKWLQSSSPRADRGIAAMPSLQRTNLANTLLRRCLDSPGIDAGDVRQLVVRGNSGYVTNATVGSAETNSCASSLQPQPSTYSTSGRRPTRKVLTFFPSFVSNTIALSLLDERIVK